MDRIKISILKDFSSTPGVREEIEGDYPGEKFLSDVLLPKFKLAVEKNVILEVHMDGVNGYPTSFLEAAFGGLVREYQNLEFVKSRLQFISMDDPFIIEDIEEYMAEALNK